MTAESFVDRLAKRYASEGFPAENIGQSTAETDSTTDRGDAIEAYWQETHSERDAFECLVRTILSQNTSDAASQPAHNALMERYRKSEEGKEADTDLAHTLAAAEQSMLAETISSAGLHNQKSETIIRIASRVIDEYGSASKFDEFVKREAYHDVRNELLDMKGVGPKTADCVLLFAGGRTGVFPVDTHVHRIYRRLGIAPPDADHETVRQVLEQEIPAEKCGFGHTASIQFGRDYCTARKPACLEGPEACPLNDLCDKVGVYPETGEVIDPAEIIE